MNITNIISILFLSFAIIVSCDASIMKDNGSTPVLNKHYKNIVSDDYESNFVSLLLQQFNIDLAQPILDIGCGNGKMSIALAKHGATEVYATDISAPHIEKLRNYIQSDNNINDSITPIAADFPISKKISQLLNEKRFSFILAYNAFNLWEANNFEDDLSRIYNALLPGGIFYIIVTNPLQASEDVMFYYDNVNKILQGEQKLYDSQCKINDMSSQDEVKCKNFKNNLLKKHQDYTTPVIESILYTLNPDYTVSSNTYNYPFEKRLPLYPIEVHNKKTSTTFLFLFRNTLHQILKSKGFDIIAVDDPNNSETISVIAIKPNV